jgi:quercetin dioxygenase-like cupin family protein
MGRVSIVIVGVAALLVPLGAVGEEVPDALSVEWQGRHPCEKLYDDAQITIARCTFAPGDVHVRHSHPGYFSYVLSGGKGQVQDERGTREFERTTGESYDSAPVAWHEVANAGDTTMSFLVVEKKYQPLAGGPRPAGQ